MTPYKKHENKSKANKTACQEFFSDSIILSEKFSEFPSQITDFLKNAPHYYQKVLNYHLWVIKKSPNHFSEASVRRIATDIGCSERTVIRAMNYWRAKKVLLTVRRRYRCLKAKRGWASYTNMTGVNRLLFASKNLLLLATLYLPALFGMTFNKPIESWSVMSYKKQRSLFKYINTSKHISTRGTPSLRHGNFKLPKKGEIGAKALPSSSTIRRDRYRKSTWQSLGQCMEGILHKKEQNHEQSLVRCLSCDQPFEPSKYVRCPACQAYGFYRRDG